MQFCNITYHFRIKGSILQYIVLYIHILHFESNTVRGSITLLQRFSMTGS